MITLSNVMKSGSKKRALFAFLFLVFLVIGSSTSIAATKKGNDSFNGWLKDLRKEAVSNGISKKVFDQAISGMDKPIEHIIELDRKQPEGTISFSQYKKNVITKRRVEQGRCLYKKHYKLLHDVSRQYGVAPQYIVALWGIETSYGQNTGGFSVVQALATLAYDGRRSKFFHTELLEAFKILQAGHISSKKMKGSWAGAMGQSQFMPSSFQRFAVDANKDGRRDIWTSLPDVFASAANYLSKSGWKEEERWGREVKLPKDFDVNLTGRNITHSLQGWARKGVRLPDGGNIPLNAEMKASIVLPDGINEPAYMVYNNYRVIMKWNKSIYFATCVGLLANQIVQ